MYLWRIIFQLTFKYPKLIVNWNAWFASLSVFFASTTNGCACVKCKCKTQFPIWPNTHVLNDMCWELKGWEFIKKNDTSQTCGKFDNMRWFIVVYLLYVSQNKIWHRIAKSQINPKYLSNYFIRLHKKKMGIIIRTMEQAETIQIVKHKIFLKLLGMLFVCCCCCCLFSQ